jgi:hypothetical protein
MTAGLDLDTLNGQASMPKDSTFGDEFRYAFCVMLMEGNSRVAGKKMMLSCEESSKRGVSWSVPLLPS